MRSFDPVGLHAEQTIRDEPFTLEWDELETMARRLVDETGWSEAWDAYELLRASGYRVGEAHLPAGLQAIRLPHTRTILVARGLRAPSRLYAVLHELSHGLLPDGSHSDVYELSLCLVHPPQQLELVRAATGTPPTPQDLFDGKAPPWCAVLRCRTLIARMR
jgi:hypothetical protein